jgi:hypothetical protein
MTLIYDMYMGPCIFLIVTILCTIYTITATEMQIKSNDKYRKVESITVDRNRLEVKY